MMMCIMEEKKFFYGVVGQSNRRQSNLHLLQEKVSLTLAWK